jgi:hypothetical protein
MEAVVEAGIDLAKSNLKKVRIIRQENGRTEFFDLKPSDIIYVPERLSLF